MSDGYPTAAQKEALRLICDHGRPGRDLPQALQPSTNPGYARAITRMAGTLTWRLRAQGFITEVEGGAWVTTATGREPIACPGEHE